MLLFAKLNLTVSMVPLEASIALDPWLAIHLSVICRVHIDLAAVVTLLVESVRLMAQLAEMDNPLIFQGHLDEWRWLDDSLWRQGDIRIFGLFLLALLGLSLLACLTEGAEAVEAEEDLLLFGLVLVYTKESSIIKNLNAKAELNLNSNEQAVAIDFKIKCGME